MPWKVDLLRRNSLRIAEYAVPCSYSYSQSGSLKPNESGYEVDKECVDAGKFPVADKG